MILTLDHFFFNLEQYRAHELSQFINFLLSLEEFDCRARALQESPLKRRFSQESLVSNPAMLHSATLIESRRLSPGPQQQQQFNFSGGGGRRSSPVQLQRPRVQPPLPPPPSPPPPPSSSSSSSAPSQQLGQVRIE